MSVLCALGAYYCYRNGVDPGNMFFVIWALFAIADAILITGRRSK
nr:MAG TPA: hypothetical protein [Caudoviricetes sp.]